MSNGLGEIVLYRTADGGPALDVRLERDTVWLTQAQMAELFGRERSVLTKHVNNVFKEGELDKESNVQILHIAGSDKPVSFYNLDVIISVGYRVKSQRGTQFRVWATNVLRQHLVQGYTVHAQRLKELNQAVRLVADVAHRRTLSGDEATALLEVVADYAYALEVLDDYDHQRVRLGEVSPGPVATLALDEARQVVARMGERFGASQLFGREKDDGLEGSLSAVMQTFDRQEVYRQPRRKGGSPAVFPGEEPLLRRRQQAHRGGAVPVVSAEEPGALPCRWRQTHRRQCPGGNDAADSRKPAGREGCADTGSGEPDQPTQSVTGRP